MFPQRSTLFKCESRHVITMLNMFALPLRLELSLTLLQSVECHFVRMESVAHHTFNYNMSRNYKLCMSFIVVCHTAPPPQRCLRVLFARHLLTFTSAKRFGRRRVNKTGVAPQWLQSGLTSAATGTQQAAPFQHTSGRKHFFFGKM